MGIVIRQSIKGSLATYIGAGIGVLINLFIVPKYIGPELYGLTRILLEAAASLAIIFQLGASSSAIRFFPYFKSPKKQNNGFFFYLVSLVSIGFLFFIPTFFIFRESIINFFSDGSPLFVNYLYWLIPLTFFLLYWTTFELYSNILMRIAIPKFIREILVRILLIAVYILYALGYLDLNGFIIGFVCVYGIGMLITFFYVSRIGSISLKHDSKIITPAIKKEFLYYSSFLIVGSLGASLVGKIDLFMIGAKMSEAWAGIYAIAYYMIAIIEIPSRSITTISSPIVANALKQKDLAAAGSLYKKVSLNQLLIGSSLFTLIWINIDNIFAIIPNGEMYSTGKWVILFVGLAKLIEMTIGFGGALISFSKFYRWNLLFTFFITLITIVSNWLLIPKFGISGAAIATFVTYVISFGLQQLLVFLKIKVHPYSIGTLKIVGVVILAISLNYILPTLDSPIIDGIYRTAIIGTLSGVLIYWLNISNETNDLIRSLLKKINL